MIVIYQYTYYFASMHPSLLNDPLIVKALNLPVPPKKKRERTLFDISGTSRKEVIISRWYRYLFRNDEDHGLSTLFLNALVDCLPEQLHDQFRMTEYKVRLEVATAKKNRIDILIEGAGADRGKFILIENKVDHWLHNDLLDYWAHAKTPDEKKVGILLTLGKEDIPFNIVRRFHNVLHKEWLAKAKKRIDAAGLANQVPFPVTDFMTAITNLNTDIDMEDQVLHYLEHSKQINKLLQTKQSTYTYLTNNIESAAKELQCKAEKATDQRLVYLRLPNAKDVSYVVKFEELFSPDLEGTPQLEISTLLSGNSCKLLDKLDAQFAHRIPPGFLHRAKEDVLHSWCHYLLRKTPITIELMKDIRTHVINEVRALQPMTTEIITNLRQLQSKS
jgi:hypothetical protein